MMATSAASQVNAATIDALQVLGEELLVSSRLLTAEGSAGVPPYSEYLLPCLRASVFRWQDVLP